MQLTSQPAALAALAQSSCPLTSQCGLDRALSWLYGAAGLLVVVLLIVLAGALLYYAKNRRPGPR